MSTLLSSLVSRQTQAKRYPRHFQVPGTKKAACGKWRAKKRTTLRELVTCAVCALMLGGCPADKPLPSCASVGCGSAALCTRDGVCTCGGERCERELVDGGVP